MLGELASDLLAKVRTVPTLESKVSLTVGGKTNDPDLTKIPLPAAWVMLRKEGKDVTPYDHTDSSGVVIDYTLVGIWTVTLMVPYSTDEDMIGVQFPLIETVRKTIHATDTPDGAMRWAFISQVLRQAYTDRLAYEQTYHVNYVTSS